MAIKRDGKWDEWTYAEYLETVEGVAKGFLALGLGRQRGVGIMGLNTPETVFSILGSVFAGGLCAGVLQSHIYFVLSTLIFTLQLRTSLHKVCLQGFFYFLPGARKKVIGGAGIIDTFKSKLLLLKFTLHRNISNQWPRNRVLPREPHPVRPVARRGLRDARGRLGRKESPKGISLREEDCPGTIIRAVVRFHSIDVILLRSGI